MAHGDKYYTVYILANRKNGTLYVGVTSDLSSRVWQHREKVHPGFAGKYDVCRLVWYTTFDSIETAIAFEKRLKKWRRAWKIKLIEEQNPDWKDLYPTLGPTNF